MNKIILSAILLAAIFLIAGCVQPTGTVQNKSQLDEVFAPAIAPDQVPEETKPADAEKPGSQIDTTGIEQADEEAKFAASYDECVDKYKTHDELQQCIVDVGIHLKDLSICKKMSPNAGEYKIECIKGVAKALQDESICIREFSSQITVDECIAGINE